VPRKGYITHEPATSERVYAAVSVQAEKSEMGNNQSRRVSMLRLLSPWHQSELRANALRGRTARALG